MNRRTTGTAGVLLLSAAAVPSAQCEVQELVGSQTDSLERFGTALSIHADLALVGAPREDGGRGGVYLFARDDGGTPGDSLDDVWVERQRLVATDPQPNAEYGAALDLDAGVALVGAPFADGTGAVYVLQLDDGGTPGDPTDDTLVDLDRLSGSVAAGGARFGRSVALSGTTLVVGTRNGNRAFVFERVDPGTPGDPFDDAFVESAVLAASDEPPASTSFSYGWAVAAADDLVVVSARRDDVAVGNSGSLYVYLRDDNGTAADALDDTWVERPKLTAADPAPDAQLGRDVAVVAGTIVGGAFRGTDAGGIATGSAHVFERADAGTPSAPLDDVWTELQKIPSPDGQQDDRFGGVLGFDGERLLVGARRHDLGQVNAGAVYVFERDDAGTPGDTADDAFAYTGKLIGAEPEVHDWFAATDVDGPWAVIGAPVDFDQPVPRPNTSPGSASFVAVELDCPFTYYGEAHAGAAGFVPQLEASGDAEPGGVVTLQVSQGFGGTFGCLLQGFSPAEIPVYAGTLLVFPVLLVVDHNLSLPPVAGGGTFSIDVPVPNELVLAGLSCYWQSVYLDLFAVGGFSFTRGLRMRLQVPVQSG